MGPDWRAFVLLSAVVMPAAAQDTPRPSVDARAELRRFADVLEAAVRKVSSPSPFQVLGPTGGSRGYLLAGYGAVFVLPARALPAAGEVIVLGTGRPGGEPYVRIRRRGGLIREPRPATETPAPPPPALGDPEIDRALAQMESQVAEYQREAERANREAERAFAFVAHEMQTRILEAQNAGVAVPLELPAPPSLPAPATAAQPPAAAPPPPAAAPQAPAAPETARPPRVAAAPQAPTAPEAPTPPPAPWTFWFQRQEREDQRSADNVVADVRSVLTQVLESHGAGLRVVRPEQVLVVAVDFTGGAFPMLLERGASERTLIVTVRKRDLDERQAGRLDAAELRKRIEVSEY